jgi:dTDP-4-dehydrorhamnose 3,5-epimerase
MLRKRQRDAMDAVSIEDILVTPLKRISTVGGDVLHALKISDSGFNGFGEIYFSWIKQGTVKAWKCHQRMTLNLVVPLGEVRFVFHFNNGNNHFWSENIGEERYVRLTVPPGIWFGFQGKAPGSSLLMNAADMEHDPDEVCRKSLADFAFEWGSE